MNNEWAFLPMRASNELLGDRAALRARLAEDSYLLFRRLLDPQKITVLRKRVLTALADRGWVRRALLMRGVAIAPPVREGDEEFFAAYDEVQKLEELHTLAHDDSLVAAMRDVLGSDSVFPHPLKIARLSFPAHYEISTPPHQDYPNNQGTPDLTAAWVPLGACPIELGPVAILRGSHRFGVLPLDWHLGAGNRQAAVPSEVYERCRWVATDFEAGDVLCFPSTTVHASMHNASEFFMRLSVDFRFQREGEPLTPGCLEPHFGRLTWDEIYAGWSSDRYQYYWKDLDYEVVPFEEYPLVRGDAVFEEDVTAFHAFERRRDARLQRRYERLAALLDPEGADAPG